MDVREAGALAVQGQTHQETRARHRRGQGNAAVSRSSRSYARILRTNVFSFYNSILFTIGAALLALGRYNDAFVSVGLGLVNAAISAVQEIRAKRKLDRLQSLSRDVVTVVRDGRDVEVAPEEVVHGDVLTDDSLAALLPAQHEGRRIINGIGTFLVRVAAQGLVIAAVTMLGLGFPYSPAQVGLTLLTVGVPTLFLTSWARPTPPDPHLLRTVGRFVIPAAVITAAGGVGVYASLYTGLIDAVDDPRFPAEAVADFAYAGLSADDVGFGEAVATLGAQTGLSTFVSYAAFFLILFLKPPSRFFASWTRPDGDRRPAILVAGLVVAFSAGLFVPWFTDYFGLTDAAEPVFVTVLPALVLWFVALSAAYRSGCSTARSA